MIYCYNQLFLLSQCLIWGAHHSQRGWERQAGAFISDTSEFLRCPAASLGSGILLWFQNDLQQDGFGMRYGLGECSFDDTAVAMKWKKKKNKKVDWSDGLQEDRVWKVENQLQGVQTILSCQQCRACMIYISKNFIEHLHFKKGSASLRCFFILTLILYLVGSEMHQKLNSTGQ